MQQIPTGARTIKTKAVFVYFIVNDQDVIEYVGMSNQVYKRFEGHLREPIPNTGFGKFHNRKDVRLELLPYGYDRKTAYQVQIYFQKLFNLKTDTEALSEGRKKGKPSVLTPRQKANIVKAYNKGKTNAELARKYNVSPRNITKILRTNVK